MIRRSLAACLAATVFLHAASAEAQEPEACRTPHLSDVGWTDITATTAMADMILKQLGYQPEVSVLSVAITFKSLQNGDIDAFLGNWMPLQVPVQKPLVESGAIEVAATNLEGARTGFAVPKAVYDAGLKTYADIAKFSDQLDGKIYGIETGSSANATISKMIADNTFGLGQFTLVESSEQAMLSQVKNRTRRDQAIVFFGWKPHPMNINFDLAYLQDGNDVFGPEDGAAKVLTVTRPGLSKDCPNLGRFLKNLVFDVGMENRLMNDILDKKMEPAAAAEAWLKENPAVLDRWLDGVTTVDGKPGLAAVKSGLGL